MVRTGPTRHFVGTISALTVVAGALGLSSAAQQPSTETALQTSIKIEVRQVLVPVVVTDQHGHNVADLKATDFAVLEDGEPQKLTWFGTSSDPTQRATLSPGVMPQGPRAPGLAPAHDVGTLKRSYLVCLDTLNSSFANFGQVRRALQKLFKEEAGGADTRYALVSLGRRTAIVENLTQDPGKILAALSSKELNRAILQSETSNLAAQESELSQLLRSYCGGCPCAGEPTSTQAQTGVAGGAFCDRKRSIELWAGGAAREQSTVTRDFLRNLEVLAAKVAELPGKRIVILVSDGFNLRPGRNLFAMLASYFADPRELQDNALDNLQPELERVLQLATGRDVTFYTLDSRGLYTTGSGLSADDEYRMSRITVLLPQVEQQRAMTALENQDALAELAETTGGVFFHNSNDLFKGLRQALADGREYYLLAYNSTHDAADGKFRQITVRVEGKGLVVRAKRGYWAGEHPSGKKRGDGE